MSNRDSNGVYKVKSVNNNANNIRVILRIIQGNKWKYTGKI
jgi:hypothetical protein